MRFLTLAIYLVLSLPAVYSAKLTLSDFSCASGYPIEVLSFLFQCDGSSCTFGDTANFTGWFQYSNLTTEVAHIQAEVSAAGYSYTLFDEEVDLCSNSTSLTGGECSVDDGEYLVEFDHTIPSSGAYDWFFTGFSLKTHILLTSDYYNTTEILGDCYATLKTSTTSQTTVAATSMRTPSAAFALIILGASFATFIFFKAVSSSGSEEEDDKQSKLIQSTTQGPDEIERARSAFAEELPWPKTGRSEEVDAKGYMA